VIVTPLVAFFAVTGLTTLHNGAVGLRGTSNTVTAELGALELAAAYAPPGYQPDRGLAPQIAAGPYLHTIRAIGSSPADSARKILAAEPEPRAAADRVLLTLEAPKLTPSVSGKQLLAASPPVILKLVGATRLLRGGCVALVPVLGASMSGVLRLPRGGILVRDQGRASASFAVKRFGDAFAPVAGETTPQSAATLSVAADDAVSIPWRVLLGGTSPLSICGLLG
jgi:hypothetical protein